MYEGKSIAELPETAYLHELKVKVPRQILIEEGVSDEGYLVRKGENWFLSPEPPSVSNRELHFLFMELCDDPMKDIKIIS